MKQSEALPKLVCAWCNPTLHNPALGHVSHGICKPCMARVLPIPDVERFIEEAQRRRHD